MYSIVFNPDKGNDNDNDNSQSDNIYLWMANKDNEPSFVYKFNNNTLKFDKYQNITIYTNAYYANQVAFLKVKNNNLYNQKPPKNTNFIIANYQGVDTTTNPNSGTLAVIYDWFTMLCIQTFLTKKKVSFFCVFVCVLGRVGYTQKNKTCKNKTHTKIKKIKK